VPRGCTNDLELLPHADARFTAAGQIESLADPLGNGHAAGARDTLSFPVFGVLKNHLYPLRHKIPLDDATATIQCIGIHNEQRGYEGKEDMGSTIRARFSHGTLKPLEAVDLREGDEVTITIVSSPKSGEDWLDRTAGGWAGLVDAEELKREIYESRSITTRNEPRL
jgi:predicted DNA-binding antitoxin AbrB/MazE fold protein